MYVIHLYENILSELGRKCHITSLVIEHIISQYETLSCPLGKKRDHNE